MQISRFDCLSQACDCYRSPVRGAGPSAEAKAKAMEAAPPWLPEISAPPWFPELPIPPWLPELAAPTCPPEIPAPPWFPELPTPSWWPDPVPPWRLPVSHKAPVLRGLQTGHPPTLRLCVARGRAFAHGLSLCVFLLTCSLWPSFSRVWLCSFSSGVSSFSLV